jgi:hypothetical protein
LVLVEQHLPPCTAAGGPLMGDLLLIGGIIALWIVLNVWILPLFGLKT